MKKYILPFIKHLSIIVSICCISYVFVVIMYLWLLDTKLTYYGKSLSGYPDLIMYFEPTIMLSTVLSLGLVILFYLRKNKHI